MWLLLRPAWFRVGFRKCIQFLSFVWFKSTKKIPCLAALLSFSAFLFHRNMRGPLFFSCPFLVLIYSTDSLPEIFKMKIKIIGNTNHHNLFFSFLWHRLAMTLPGEQYQFSQNQLKHSYFFTSNQSLFIIFK
jgi:hypothetical protein